MRYKKTLFAFVLSFGLLSGQYVMAGEYQPLVGIPGLPGNLTMESYINALYLMSISIAALLAVIKIIIAGVKWMLTDIVTGKQSAKDDIQNSLIGLLIVMAAVLILQTINPALTGTNVFSGVDPASAPGAGGSPTASPQTRARDALGPDLVGRARPTPGGFAVDTTRTFEAPPNLPPDPVTGAPQTGGLTPDQARQRQEAQNEAREIRSRMQAACSALGGNINQVESGSGANVRITTTCDKPL